MRFRPSVVLALACALVVAMTGTAAASNGRAPAKFMKPNMEKKLSKKGAKGVSVPLAALNTECPGVQSPGVSAGGCIVAPYGCTANFIFTDGSSQYVGTVAKMTSGEGVPGNDWALIKIDPAVAAEWGVNPAMPVIGGPQGVYTGCGPTPVFHYGHGYGVAVGQGKVEGGLATNVYDDGYGWTGAGAPGDSGSGVLTAPGGPAIGDFTHLIVDLGAYPGSDLAGTRITKILSQFGVSLVNADGSTTGAAATSCGNAPQ